MIYLDSAATSLLKPAGVYRAAERAMRECASPSRGAYPAAMAAAEIVYSCREAAGELFRCAPEQVVFTMNATHALNLAICSLCRSGMRVLISGYEHNAVLRPLRALGAELRIARTPLFDRAAALAGFRRELADCELCVCTHVSNVFGFVLPVGEIAAACREAGVPLIVDASQSAGVLDVDLREWNCAFVAMPGHKGLMGPQGTGLLLCNHETRPLLYGGTGSDSRNPHMPDALPERLEAGTMNVAGIAGLLEGLRYILLHGTDALEQRERKLSELFLSALGDTEGFFLSAEPAVRCGVLSCCREGRDCEETAAALAAAGVCVRAGLHCAPLAHETVGTLESGTVRFSFSPLLSSREVLEAAEITEKILKK